MPRLRMQASAPMFCLITIQVLSGVDAHGRICRQSRIRYLLKMMRCPIQSYAPSSHSFRPPHPLSVGQSLASSSSLTYSLSSHSLHPLNSLAPTHCGLRTSRCGNPSTLPPVVVAPAPRPLQCQRGTSSERRRQLWDAEKSYSAVDPGTLASDVRQTLKDVGL